MWIDAREIEIYCINIYVQYLSNSYVLQHISSRVNISILTFKNEFLVINYSFFGRRPNIFLTICSTEFVINIFFQMLKIFINCNEILTCGKIF